MQRHRYSSPKESRDNLFCPIIITYNGNFKCLL